MAGHSERVTWGSFILFISFQSPRRQGPTLGFVARPSAADRCSPPWPFPAQRPEAAFRLLPRSCSHPAGLLTQAPVVSIPPTGRPCLTARACPARFSFESLLGETLLTPQGGDTAHHGAFSRPLHLHRALPSMPDPNVITEGPAQRLPCGSSQYE